MSTAEEELQILYDNLYQIRVVNYMTIAGVAFLTYDILTNLDKEIPLIWRYYRDHDDYGGASWGLKARRALIQVLFIFAQDTLLVCHLVYFCTSAFKATLVNNHVGFSVPVRTLLVQFMLSDLVMLFSVVVARTISSIPSCEHPDNRAYTTPFISVHSAGEILYTTLVNVILIMRLNALYQIFNGTEGLRKYQIFLAACVISEYDASCTRYLLTPNLFRLGDSRVYGRAHHLRHNCGLGSVQGGRDSPWNPLARLRAHSYLHYLVDRSYARSNLAFTVNAFITTATFFGSTLYLLFSSIRWKFKRFSDFTIANIKEEIRNIQPMTLLLIRDGLLFYFP
ncbi:hypothetical protein ID866_7929 [Astraeus odoratus]|nr:hypothetical protein ID866_7929 [Astraeus odoratus]